MEDFVATAEILKERGAYKIYVMATHGLLSGESPRLIEESAIDEVKHSIHVELNINIKDSLCVAPKGVDIRLHVLYVCPPARHVLMLTHSLTSQGR